MPAPFAPLAAAVPVWAQFSGRRGPHAVDLGRIGDLLRLALDRHEAEPEARDTANARAVLRAQLGEVNRVRGAATPT